MTRYSHTWMKLGLALALTGCSLSNEDVDPGGGDDVTPPPHTLTIYDIRNPDSEYHPAEGSTVTLEGKVVTAIAPFDDASNRQSFYIAEPEGGEWSGIYVYDSNKLGFPVAVGDVVTVKGAYSEYLPSSSTLTVSEIGYTEFTVESSGADVPVFSYPATALADIATGGSRAESFESVLLELDAPVQVVSIEGYGEIKIGSDLQNSVRVDDTLFPDAEVGKVVGQPLTTVRGILWYSFGDSKLEPRDASDLVAGQVTYADATVYQLRDRSLSDAVPAGQAVRLTGMVVTGASGSGTGSFFAQLPAASWRTPGDASYSGIFVNRGAASANTVVHVGDLVTVEGGYIEFPTGVAADLSLSQVNAATVTVSGTATVPLPVVVAPVTVATAGSNAEKYESVLVRVEGVTVTAKSDAVDKEFIVDDSLHVDDYLYAGASTAGDDAYGKGPIHFIQGPVNFYGGVSKIEPRSAADMDATPATTVYAIRRQDVPAATTYAVPGVVVTALVAPDGTGDFVVQVPSASQDATLGAKYSAMYVTRGAGATTPVAMGELVSVIGQYSGGGDPYVPPVVFEASSIYADPARTAPVPPAAIVADPSTIATGGADVVAYESALVEVDDVALVDPNPDAPADNGEFMVDGNLRVDDLLSSTADRYGRLATTFQYLRGVLYFDALTGDYKLEPRSMVDMLRNSIPAAVKTVYELQDPADAGMPALDDQVQVEHVVVTAVVGDGYGSFWVQMPEATLDARGHAYSGIYCDRGAGNTAAQRVQVGDVVTVAGQYIEESEAAPVLTALLVDASGVTYESSDATLPDVEPITDPATLAEEATAEPWESVLVSVSGVVVLDQNPDAPADHGESLVGEAGAAAGVRVDDLLDAGVPTTVRRAVAGLSSVTGVLVQAGARYALEPRNADDLVVYPIPDVSIYDLQDPAASPVVGTGARITGVISGYVTSSGPYWVQVADADRDATLGARYSGIYCVPTPVALLDNVTVRSGDVVTLEGTYTEDAGLSTFLATKVTKGVTGTVSAVDLDMADLEAYEGVLVRVGAVDVTNDTPDDPDLGEFVVTGDLRVGSMILPSAALLGRSTTGFTAITGLLHYGDGQYKLEPRTGADLTAAAPYVLEPYVIQDPAYHMATNVMVHIDGLIVTAVASDGSFFSQLATPDPVLGTGFSSMYVYKPATPVAVGDIVSVEGKYKEYNGLSEIDAGATVEVASSGNALPAATVVPAASIATGGADAEKYESVLVRVENVGMATKNPDEGSGDYGEFEVTGGLRVDDTLWKYDAALLRDQPSFTYIQGPLYYSYGNTKLEPRGASDVQYP